MRIGARTWFGVNSCVGFDECPYNRLQLILLLSVSLLTFSSSSNDDPSSCGNIRNISCPFYLKGDLHHNCDHHSLRSHELECQDNRTIIYMTRSWYRKDNKTYKYYLADINYQNHTVRLIPTDVNHSTLIIFDGFSDEHIYNTPLILMKCPAPITSNSQYIDATTSGAFSSCSNNTHGKNYCPRQYSYIVAGHLKLRDLVDGCMVSYAAWVSSDWWPNSTRNTSDITIISKADDDDIHSEAMDYGFDISWRAIFCSSRPLAAAVWDKPDSRCNTEASTLRSLQPQLSE
ncbi:hypothetical protein ACET3Z_015178 [Daucus carota]